MTEHSREVDERVDSRRRKLLAALGAGGAAGLAGCSSGGGDGGGSGTTGGNGTTGGTGTTGGNGTTSEGTSVPHVEGATLKGAIGTAIGNIDWGSPPPNYQRLTYDTAATVNSDGEIVPMLVDDYEIVSDSEITFHVRDDATWSNGNTIKAVHHFAEQFTGHFCTTPGEEEPRLLSDIEETGPEGASEAITNMTFDGKTATWHSSGGWFADFDMESLVKERLTNDMSKLEWPPTRDFVQAAIEIAEQVDEPLSEEGYATVEEIATEYTVRGYGTETSSTQDPIEREKNEAVSGPWKLAEAREDRLIMEPNEHHRNADKINFDTIELRPQATNNNLWTGLQTNNIDYHPDTLPKTNIIEEFPDNVQAHQYGGWYQYNCLYLPAQHEYLGQGPVRQAILRALQKDRLAQVQHEYAAQPLETPPGLGEPDADQWIDEDLRSSFVSYDYDTDAAASLLEGVGFSKEGGTWMTPDGDEFSVTLTTGQSTVQTEQAIVSDLQNFGIAASLQTVSSNWSSRFNNGDFQMTLAPRTYRAADGEMYYKAIVEEARRKRLGLWDNERVVSFAENNSELKREDYDWTYLITGLTEEMAKEFTVSAPPVGEHDADPTEEYPVAYYQMVEGEALDEETRREHMQNLMWVWNWKLPLLPTMSIGNIAFMDHANWIAPEDDAAWNLGFPDPFHIFMNEGRIQANPEGNF